MKLLVTGAAGFIGMHVAARLLRSGHEVVGVDSLNEYYDPQLKTDRLAQLRDHSHFVFERLDLAEPDPVRSLFSQHGFQRVVHLAAQAGVRYSIEHPEAYISSNLVAFGHLLEACRKNSVEHLVYASSSSVYGDSQALPLSEDAPVDHPISLYAATKRSNELMAHAYAHLFSLPVTGLRFFTVYGPWGRPDMAPILFSQAICAGRTIEVFGHGRHRRDFTYIDDVVTGVQAVVEGVPPGIGEIAAKPSPARAQAPFRLYNIGNSQPVQLMDFLDELQRQLGMAAKLRMTTAQPGDVRDTWADCSSLQRDFDYRPDTPLAEGVERFVRWFREYYDAGVPA